MMAELAGDHAAGEVRRRGGRRHSRARLLHYMTTTKRGMFFSTKDQGNRAARVKASVDESAKCVANIAGSKVRGSFSSGNISQDDSRRTIVANERGFWPDAILSP